MKLDKDKVSRRVQLLADEGIEFVTNAHIGVDVDIHDLKSNNDALVLCIGSTSETHTHTLVPQAWPPLTLDAGSASGPKCAREGPAGHSLRDGVPDQEPKAAPHDTGEGRGQSQG